MSTHNKGITLIALIITIIVMLILVAVTINMAVNGGLFEYAGKAATAQKLAALEEQLYSAYMEEIMKDYGNRTNTASLANAIAKVNANGEYEIVPIVASGATSITLSESNIVIGTDDATKTATFTATPVGNGDVTNYYVVEGGKYYKINYNSSGLINIEKDPGSVNTNGNSLSIVITDETIATGSITGNTVTITGTKTAGNTTFKVKYGNSVEATGTIEAIAPVTITFNLNGGNISGNTENVVISGLSGTSVNIPTAPTKTNLVFKGWYDAAENGNLVYGTNVTTAEVPSSAVTYYAGWQEPKQAFRTYGTPVATNTVAGTYGTLGTSVQLNGGSAITVGGTNAIADNWKVFYEDADFVYLIYGDYYPVNVQTNTNVTFGGNKSEAVSASSRANLLKYLRNNSAYTWNTSNPYGDNHGTGGAVYTSWSNLQTALSGLSTLSNKTITIQGSPDIELWVESWNAKGNTKLKTGKTSNGYQIGLNSGTVANYIDLSSYTTVAGKDYNDTLYFPYKTEQTTANGYWLASPSASDSNRVCGVGCNGIVGYVNYNNTSYCARPLVSIEK